MTFICNICHAVYRADDRKQYMPHQDELLRQVLVDRQLRPNKITCPRVLKAFITVSRQSLCRHHTISTSIYRDSCIPLKPGRILLSPLLMAQILQWANIQPHETVCVLASSLGYMGALIRTYNQHVSVQDLPEHLYNNNDQETRFFSGIKLQAHSIHKGPIEPVDVVIIDGGEVEQWPEEPWQTKRTIALYNKRIVCRETAEKAPLDIWLNPDFETRLPEFRATHKKNWLA